jgi:hypothetical protein
MKISGHFLRLEILLYFSLRQCILERPGSVFPNDIKRVEAKPVYEAKNFFIKTNYE